MTKAELDRVIEIISTHDEGEGQYCDTGADMEWACRSDCVELAIDRLRREFKTLEIEEK